MRRRRRLTIGLLDPSCFLFQYLTTDRARALIERLLKIMEMAQHELLLFSAIWLLIGALDDLLIDLIWVGRWSYRRVTFYARQPPLRIHQLKPPKRPGLLAVFIPTWREASVIGTMLARCSNAWQDTDTRYRIYVGCYPNDKEGIAVISRAAQNDAHVQLVLLAHLGPTTKADCLNGLWQALCADELRLGFKAKAVVLHDAEDSVHPDELSVYDRMIEKASAVQLPVMPVPTVGSRWVSAHYCDEFAEAHGKTMVVREAIGAALPLAGVGCAIDRNLLGRIAFASGGTPFDDQSLTEDYELGLKIGTFGGHTMMARILDSQGNLIGTRACFPGTLKASVRQKTRWLTGIALAGWDRLGWSGSISEKWMRLHDRRSIFAALVLMAAYLCMILTAVLIFADLAGIYNASALPQYLPTLLWFNALFLTWRLVVRALFVGTRYGWRQALLSIPRSIVANIIAIAAARRACVIYLKHCFGVPLVWDKTAHHVVPGNDQ